MTAPGQDWQIVVAGYAESVALVPYAGPLWGSPTSFRVRDLEVQLEYPPGTARRRRYSAARMGAADLGAHRVVLTLTPVRLAYGAAVRRNIAGLRKGGPLALIAGILGGSAASGGTAAAGQTSLAWLVYSLSVDAQAAGSWVAKTVDGQVIGWRWVPPGGPLPDDRTVDF